MFAGEYPSQLLENAVEQFASLPGIGRKSALRLALHLLRQPVENVERFSGAFTEFRKGVKYCRECNMITDSEVCPICEDGKRDCSVICVVESVRDVLSIERTGRYHGLYHVLGGIISPIDGIGPSDLPIEKLVERVKSGAVQEVILALSTGMEGETTAFYLYKKLSGLDIRITAIARGIGFGDDLEYADELTLGKSIENRQLFKF
ncbi:MAG: recombination protein RecR [Bacteroidetes bacterium]|uniref:Recombination protein RecR n=1 Tax=Candidatus Egerieousia excrementavium TaxID=2840778 RepID=A0A9D9DJU3_9BACT|nr:recombination protein RecR [Candidatus Egerieousia excrementavium]